MLLNANQIIAERYEIVEKIGVGGMAMVYLAKDLKLGRKVTFKVLKEEHLTDDFVFSKFSTEAKAAASLSNQNIVSVYDVGVQDNIHYIVMEYIDGITLKELIKSRAPFRNEEAIGVAIQIAQALSHAHANKIVHQDIKPQNILLTHSGIVKVTDFGIASAQVSSTTTTTTTPVGSVHYFSPEQARGRYVDHRSDIYSLGIVLYEMVVGNIPFEGDSSVAIAIKHINEPIPDLPKNVSQSLRSIILKATKKLSNQRYSTVEEMLEDLKLAITDETPLIEMVNNEKESTIVLDIGEQEEINARLSQVAITSTDSSLKTIQKTSVPPEPPKKDVPKFDVFNPTANNNQNKQLERKIIFIGIGTALVISIIILIAIIIEVSSDDYYNGLIVYDSSMPSLQGLTLEDGQLLLSQYNIEIDLEENIVWEYNEEIPYGTVIRQIPNEGTSFEDIQQLQLTVSLGQLRFTVPDFIGTTFAYVQAIMSEVEGVNLSANLVPSDAPFSSIIVQFPQPGTVIGYGDTISLQVAHRDDATTTLVPQIVGLTELAAAGLLQQAGLSPSITRVNHDSIPSGTVINQTPSQGSSINIGSSVSLTISLGPVESLDVPEPTPMPEPEPTTELTPDPEPAPDPEPTPDLEPMPEPEPTPEPTPDPEPQIPEQQMAIINLPFNLLGDFDIETNPLVHVSALVNGVVVFDSMIPATNFPITIPVSGVVGSGQTVVQFLVSGNLAGYEIINF